MSKLILSVAVVMERLKLSNPWQPYRWEAQGVIPDGAAPGTAPRILMQDGERLQMLFPGFQLALHRSEAENYYLNLSTPTPKVFIAWRPQDELAAPWLVTVSYGEAARMMDASEQVDAVAMPPDIADWVGDFVNKNYQPEPRKKIRRRDPLREE